MKESLTYLGFFWVGWGWQSIAINMLLRCPSEGVGRRQYILKLKNVLGEISKKKNTKIWTYVQIIGR